MRNDSNGRPARQARAKTPPSRNSHDDGELLQEAVTKPGAVEIPDEQPAKAGAVVEIPEEMLDPSGDVCGQSLDRDPATMTAPLGRPSPHSWNELFPELVLNTVLLPIRQQRDGAPIYHWVTPSLRGPVSRRLRQVQVHLLFDTGGEGDAFLWIVPVSEFSPYYAAVSLAIGKGAKFLRENLIQFEYRQDQKKVAVSVRPRGIDDPAAVLPSRPISKLLPEALKADRLITAPSHPVYAALVAGSRLT
jgi:hypothetical protein